MEVHHEPIEKNYQLLEEIGKQVLFVILGSMFQYLYFKNYRGQFAIVRKCKEMKTGILYAAKIMRKRRVARGVAAADIGINFIMIVLYIVKNICSQTA